MPASRWHAGTGDATVRGLARAGQHTAADRAELLERHRESILDRIAELQEALVTVDEKIAYYRSLP